MSQVSGGEGYETRQAEWADLNVAFELASMYLSLNRTNEANLVLERLVQQPNADAKTLLSVANAYSQLQNMIGLEAALSKLVMVLLAAIAVSYIRSGVMLTLAGE